MQKIVQFLRRRELPEALEILLFGSVKKDPERELQKKEEIPVLEKQEILPEPVVEAVPPKVEKVEKVDFDQMAVCLEEWAKVPENCCKDYDMTALARYTGQEYEQVRSYFRDRIPVSFRTWRMEMKLDVAKRLLLEKENLRIEEVAVISGFYSIPNFYRRFKRSVGCTPLQWRSCRGNLKLLDEFDD